MPMNLSPLSVASSKLCSSAHLLDLVSGAGESQMCSQGGGPDRRRSLRGFLVDMCMYISSILIILSGGSGIRLKFGVCVGAVRTRHLYYSVGRLTLSQHRQISSCNKGYLLLVVVLD